MQTTKARAKPIGSGMWLVTHPDTLHSVGCHLPHDSAKYLLEKFVLRNQILTRAR